MPDPTDPLRERLASIVASHTGNTTDALNVADQAIHAAASWLEQRSRVTNFLAAIALRTAAKVLAGQAK